MNYKKVQNTVFILFSLLLSHSFFGQNQIPKKTQTEYSYDFGNVKKGTIVSHTFEIFNTSDSAIAIISAIPQCGCTIPEIPKGIIETGESQFLKVTFDTRDKFGYQRKTIQVNLSNQKSLKLLIYAQIIE